MKVKDYFKSGSAYIWLNAGAVTICLIMIIGILGLIASRGLSHFWPSAIMQATYQDQTVVGELYDTKTDPAQRLIEAGQPVPQGINPKDEVIRYSLKVGNKDITGQDFIWVVKPLMTNVTYPKDLYKVERTEAGNLYGRLTGLTVDNAPVESGALHAKFQDAIDRATKIRSNVHAIEKSDMGKLNYKLDKLRLQERKYELENKLTDAKKAELAKEKAELEKQFAVLQEKTTALHGDLERDKVMFTIANGQTVNMPISHVIEATQPNNMGFFSKLGHFLHNLWVFLVSEPREANTEGGVFPAIFGTVTMVFLMTVFVTPLGVIAAVYLREYASQGKVTQIVRIAVNNLAGVPSIVYGVFGLGFFVYVLGGQIDQIFYPESLPQPVFGTPGLLWASITLALLTLPVVIVATEEGLTRIPRSLKEGSLALGATKAETLWRVVLPMAAPSIMTGVILAIARAAGEVAPLMLVGVVKFAPNLPVDGNAPFVHFEQKIMHLGFHIYDVGFQSPNVEASRPLVYATAFLLVLVVAVLNLAAVAIRNRMREKFKSLEH